MAATHRQTDKYDPIVSDLLPEGDPRFQHGDSSHGTHCCIFHQGTISWFLPNCPKEYIVNAIAKVLLITAVLGLGAGVVYAADEVRPVSVGSFEAVDVGGGIKLVVLQDASYSLRVSGSTATLDRLEIKVIGKTLHIGFKPFSGFSLGQVSAQVTMPKLTGLDISGGSRAEVRFDARSTKNLGVDLSGGAELSGTIIASTLSIDASGGSVVEIEGYAEALELEASGGSRMDSADFAIGKAHVEASGGCYVMIAVQNELDVEASGGSSINYRGSPKLTSSTSGGSSIHHQE